MSISWSYMSGHGRPLVTTSLIINMEKKTKKKQSPTHECMLCFLCNLQYNANRRGLIYPGWVWQCHFAQWHLEFARLSIHTSRKIDWHPCHWYKRHACGGLAWVDCLRCHESGKQYYLGAATPLPSCISFKHISSTPVQHTIQYKSGKKGMNWVWQRHFPHLPRKAISKKKAHWPVR